MGTTLEVNDISINEALQGKVNRKSVLPATLPQPTQSGSPELNQ
jgi:hypothetical protein